MVVRKPRDKAYAFALRSEMAWLELVSQGSEREAVAWGRVIDAVFADNPGLAITRARKAHFPEKTISAIRDAFDLTDAGDRV